MARRNRNPELPRTFQELSAAKDDYARHARQAIAKLTTESKISEFDIALRINVFGACAYLGSGLRWSDRFAIERSRARSLAERLRNDARDFQMALTKQSRLVLASYLSPEEMIARMNLSAAIIEESLRDADDRLPDWTLEPKRELTQFVWRRSSGKPFDKELAEIIAAVLNLERYTAEEQRKFRERHCCLEGTDSIFSSAPTESDSPKSQDKIESIKG